jgi:hypothetical protein
MTCRHTRLNDELLTPRGLMPLGETAGYLYFVMAHDEVDDLGVNGHRHYPVFACVGAEGQG